MPPSQKKQKKYSNVTLQLAVQEYIAALAKPEQPDSLRSISKKYNIPRSTLHDKARAAQLPPSPGAVGSGSPYFTLEQEQLLVDYIKEWQYVGEPVNTPHIQQVVGAILDASDAKVLRISHRAKESGSVSRRFVDGLLRRHKELVKRKSRTVEAKRSKSVTTLKMVLWEERVRKILTTFKVVCLLNADESGFTGFGMLRRVQMTKKIGDVNLSFDSDGNDLREHWSLMACIGTNVKRADGTQGPDVLPPALIFKGKRQLSDSAALVWKNQVGQPTYVKGSNITVTESANMNATKFMTWLKKVTFSLSLSLSLSLHTHTHTHTHNKRIK